MPNSRSVSVRLSENQLQLIDDSLEGNPLSNRSRFITRCAVKQADRILKGKVPYYLPQELEDDDSDITTTTVSIDAEDEELIESACSRLNAKLSPFLVQATMAQLFRGKKKA
jgi:uncharacterized protein (DUF1778 family)